MSKIEDSIKLDFDHVLIKPKWSDLNSRSEVNLIRKFKFKNSGYEWEGFPLIVANLDTTGTIEMSKAMHKHRACVALHKFYSVDEIYDILKFEIDNSLQTSWVTTGITENDLVRLDKINSKIPIERIVIDVANGYTESFCRITEKICNKYCKAAKIAGNITTPEMVNHYILNCGVDICKIGIGPGQFCKTRSVTGVGYGQLSAIMECSEAAHGLNAHICADGGIKTSGDLAKAYGSGSDFVMIGGLFAGTSCCYGEWYNNINEKRFIAYGKQLEKEEVFESRRRDYTLKCYGMSSKEAQEKYGEFKEYRASEGDCKFISYKGTSESILLELMGGLRSTCTYVGADKLKDLSKCTTFVRIK